MQTPVLKPDLFEESAKHGELLVLCPLYRAIDSVIELAGKENFSGKIVIDTTNPIAEEPPVNGVLKYIKTADGSAGEYIQNKLPAAHIVKVFNSIGSAFMYKPKFEEGQPTMFICGNNDDAKKNCDRYSGSIWLGCDGFRRYRSIQCARRSVYHLVRPRFPRRAVEPCI